MSSSVPPGPSSSTPPEPPRENGPTETASGPAWLIRPPYNSAGVHLAVEADSDVLDSGVFQALTKLAEDLQRTAAAEAKKPKICPKLGSCNDFKGECPNLSHCGRFT